MRRSSNSSRATIAFAVVVLVVTWLSWRGTSGGAPPGSRDGGAAQPPDDATVAAQAEVARTPATDDVSPPAVPEALAEAIAALLFGGDDGMPGYLRCVNLVASGEVAPEQASHAALSRLVADAGATTPVLRQVGLPAALLLADTAPTRRVAALGRRYRTDGSTHALHAALRARLGTWPDPLDPARVEALVASLLDLSAPALATRLAELLRSSDPHAHRAVRQALRSFASQGDASRIAVAAWALLHTEDGPTSGVAELLGCAAELQFEQASERTGPAINHLALAVRSMLAGGQYVAHAADPRLRATLVDALARAAGGAASQHGTAVFAAIALGGVGEDVRAASALAGLVKANVGGTIGNTAVVNLGYATDPAGFLALLPRFPDAPADAAAVLPHLDYLVGLMMATRRHPEQAEAAVPFLASTLTVWTTTALHLQARRNVLDLIADDLRPEFAPLLRRIAEDPADIHAAVARQLLERLR
jgi:hypothetical protein